MMYRGSKFLAVSIIELPLINKVSLELISARGDGGGAKIIYPLGPDQVYSKKKGAEEEIKII